MLSLKKIWTIARYEVKTLLRSWFFRIFAGLVLIVLTFFNITFFAQAFDTMPWTMRGIPSSIPYFNMLLLNVAQAVIAIFLASDFLKRDRKSNTTEVIYMRSMSNADYVIGKTLGLFLVFLGLNLAMLIISSVVHGIFTDAAYQPAVYLYYLLLISVPTLVFVFGLSFLMMTVVRNQAVTFILLLGYFAVAMVVLNYKYAATFDSVAFFLPLAWSDFVGFADLGAILIQRLAYMFLGLGFIFLTILLFKRLPQSRAMQMISLVLSAFFIVAGAGLFGSYFLGAKSGEKLRTRMIALNDQYAAAPKTAISAYDIDLAHNGATISATAKLTVVNKSDQPLDSFLFSLNPGLKVEKIELNGSAVDFTRDLHLLFIKPAEALAPASQAELSISYHGAIDNRACYLATPREERDKPNQVVFYKRGKEHSFVEPDYVLLTSEANWYPMSGASQGTALMRPRQKNFAVYTLKVKTAPNLAVISQGIGATEGDVTVFMPEKPLTQMSLVIGPYQKRSLEVDSVTYSLYTLPAHNYFVPEVAALKDTLAPMIRELKNDYEIKTNVNYPYNTFSLVEVPVHFKTYARPLVFHQDWVQPQLVFLPENGAAVGGLDFKTQAHRSQNRMEERNETVSETEMQYQMVRSFFETELFATRPNRSFGDFMQEPGMFVIFPNFYAFCNSLSSTELPILDATLEAYLKAKVETAPFGPMRFREAFSDDEKANIALRGQSLQQLLADPENIELASIALKTKSDYLFRLLESRVGSETVETFLDELLEANQFAPISQAEFVAAVQEKLDIPFENVLTGWYSQDHVPGFHITDLKYYKIVQGDRSRYQITCNVYNAESVDGVVLIDFVIPGGGFGGPGGGPGGFGRFNFSESGYERAIHLEPGQAKQVGFVLDDQPRMMTINTLVSRNLPSEEMRRLEDFAENNSAQPFDGVKTLDAPPLLSLPGEIIVDNEDEGFKVESVESQSALKKLFKIQEKDQEEFVPFNFWRAPNAWHKTVNAVFYGDFEHSAHFIRAGDGDKKVAWETELAEAGQYEVYAYGEQLPFRGRFRGPGGGGPGGGGGSDIMQSLHFTVYHDDGAEEVEWDPESAQGWNYLGSFYMSAGLAKVELSNNSNGRLVVADAVKWVKK